MAPTANATCQAAELQVAADGPGTRQASLWMAEQAGRCEVPADQVMRLDLCLNEVLANVVHHGTTGGADPLIRLLLQVQADADGGVASLTVSDGGPAFDMTHQASQSRPTTLAETEPGGLGLLMIRSFSDELRYEYRDGRNHLSFAVRWARTDG